MGKRDGEQGGGKECRGAAGDWQFERNFREGPSIHHDPLQSQPLAQTHRTFTSPPRRTGVKNIQCPWWQSRSSPARTQGAEIHARHGWGSLLTEADILSQLHSCSFWDPCKGRASCRSHPDFLQAS